MDIATRLYDSTLRLERCSRHRSRVAVSWRGDGVPRIVRPIGEGDEDRPRLRAEERVRDSRGTFDEA